MQKNVGALLHERLTEQVIGAAIEVHRELGPGLLESAYEECLSRELELRDISHQRQVVIPLEYREDVSIAAIASTCLLKTK